MVDYKIIDRYMFIQYFSVEPFIGDVATKIAVYDLRKDKFIFDGRLYRNM